MRLTGYPQIDVLLLFYVVVALAMVRNSWECHKALAYGPIKGHSRFALILTNFTSNSY